jgi:hypothetical protein
MESELDMVIAANNADANRRDKKLEYDPAPFGVMYERMREMLMFLLNNVQMDMTKFPSEASEYALIVKELTMLNGSAESLEDWHRRYKDTLIAVAGITEAEAQVYLDTVNSVDYCHEPEDAANEELSCWPSRDEG